LYGPYEQLQSSSWQSLNGNEQLGETYQRCCTSVSWWARRSRFICCMGKGSGTIRHFKTQSGFDYAANWDRQGQTQDWLQGEVPQYSFIDDMWKARR